MHYVPIDINSLSGAERIVALYGSEDGCAIWEKFSKSFQNRLAKELPSGPIDGKEYIVLLTTLLRSKNAVASDRDLVMLAAGRFVAWKGAFDYEEDGEWKKK